MSSALVVDFGGVVTRTLFETHALTEKKLGLPPGTLTWRGPFAPGEDALWTAMQRDEISERDYWQTRTQEVSNLVGQSWTRMSDFVSAARGNCDPDSYVRPEAMHAMRTARALGARVGILSNELDLFYGKNFTARLPFLSLVNAIVDATYTGILKPDPRAYELCAAELDVALTRCVFVDDQQRNVAGARAVGMQAVKFDVRNPSESFDAALARLEALAKEHDHA